MRLSGLLALLGAGTALADPSFEWDTFTPTQNAETKEVALTQTATFSASDFGSGNGVALNQINLASVADDFSLDSSVGYSLVSVVVSVTLVSNDGPEWSISNTSGLDGSITPTEWSMNYTLPVTVSLGDGDSDPLQLSALGSTPLTVPAERLDDGELFVDNGQSFSFRSSLTSTAQEISIPNDNEGNLDAFLTGSDGASVNAGTLASSANTPGVNNLNVSVLPNLSLRVTITYNLVPEPTSFALLMTGAAFLLRRRRKLVK